MATFATERATDAGELLFQAGEASSDLFVVLEGEVEVVRFGGADAVVIVTYGPGGFVGELNLLTGQRRSLSCRVTEPGRVLVIAEAEFRRLMGVRPALADTIFGALCRARLPRTPLQRCRSRHRRSACSPPAMSATVR